MHLMKFMLSLLILASFVGQASANDAKIKILAFGDSLTAGYGLPAGTGYPGQLKKLLSVQGYNVEVINAGVTGETTTGGLNRIDWAMQHKPDLVLLGLGANDALRFLDPKLTESNLSAIVEKIKAKDAAVMLLGMYAFRNAGEVYTTKFDGIYPRLAQKYDVPLYPFLLEGVALNPVLNLKDGLHPNQAGAKIMATNMAPLVAQQLDLMIENTP